MLNSKKVISSACPVILLGCCALPAIADCVLDVGVVAGGGNRITCDSNEPNPYQGVSNAGNGRTSALADEVILQADTVIAPDADESTFDMGLGNDDISGTGAVIFGTGTVAIDMGQGNNSITLSDSALFGSEGVEELVNDGAEVASFSFDGVRIDSLGWGARGIATAQGNDILNLTNSRMVIDDEAMGVGIGDDTITILQSTIDSRGAEAIGSGLGSDEVSITDSIVITRETAINGAGGGDTITIENSRLESKDAANPLSQLINAGTGTDNIVLGNCSEIVGNVVAGQGDDVVVVRNLSLLEGTLNGDRSPPLTPSLNDTLRFEQQLAASAACTQLMTEIPNLPTPNGSITIDGITYNYEGFENIESAITCSTAFSCADAPEKGAGDLLFDGLRPPRGDVPQAVSLPVWAYLGALGLLGLLGAGRLRRVV